MTSTLRPNLRRSITGHPDPQDENFVWLYDAYRFSNQSVRLHRAVVEIVSQFNGNTSLADIQSRWSQAGRGLLPSSVLEQLIEALDRAMLLDGQAYQHALSEYRKTAMRSPVCLGCYPSDPDKLRNQLDGLFLGSGGPGLPDFSTPSSGSLRGALIPHIDFARGKVTYGWGFKELIEHSDAEVFVILGTSHFSPARFILTRKDFSTPLGLVPTDQSYVAMLADAYGEDAFADELAHVPEHSIELHAVVLQHVMQRADRSFKIVPVLIGSFHDALACGIPPEEIDSIRRMIKALQLAEQTSRQKVAYLISGDLAHIGPKFGDSGPLDTQALSHSRSQDFRFLQSLEQLDRQGAFSILQAEGDSRRICGFPPVYTFLAVAHPNSARQLHYQQFVALGGQESVSFASLCFYEA